jgi:peptidoglycan/LPS O-acetylase OafA/YrhL
VADVGRDRLHFLDALRGLAALYVVIFHVMYVGIAQANLPFPAYWQAVEFGGTGVFLFFVISGFSLCLTWGRHAKAPWPEANYAISRFFRIAPLFYVVLGGLLAQGLWLFRYVPGLGLLIPNLAFLFNLLPGKQEGIVPASWAIGVEMLFYTAFPALRRLPLGIALGGSLALFGALLTLAGPVEYPNYAYWTVIGWLPLFAIGMCAYGAFARWHARVTLGVPLALTGLLLLIACAVVPHAQTTALLRVPIGLGYAVVLVGLGLRTNRVVVNAATQFLGKISFSVYLLHTLVLRAIIGIFPAIYHSAGVQLGFLVCSALELAIVLPVAFIAYHLVEAPGERLGKHVAAALARGLQSRLETSPGSGTPTRHSVAGGHRPAVAPAAAKSRSRAARRKDR